MGWPPPPLDRYPLDIFTRCASLINIHRAVVMRRRVVLLLLEVVCPTRQGVRQALFLLLDRPTGFERARLRLNLAGVAYEVNG